MSIDELSGLDITPDNRLNLLAIGNDGFEVYSVLNVDKSKLICILTPYDNHTFDITTKDGRVFKLLRSSTSAINSKTVISSKISARISMSTSLINLSQQCICCDKFDHYYSTSRILSSSSIWSYISHNPFKS